MKLFLLLIALLQQFQWQALSLEKWFKSPANTTCACPGEVLTYTCTTDRGNATIWRGTAFKNCVGNEIMLRHDKFIDGTLGKCNDGDILGQSIDVDGKYFISQLSVNISNELNNKMVTCISDSMADNKIIGESKIKVAGPVRSAPDNILVGAQKGKLLFSWTPVSFNNCSSLKYNITSDCGTCPSITNTTAAACSGLRLTTNAVVCQFRVNSVVCDQAGASSSPVSITLKVPNVPQVKLVPSYSNDSQALKALFIVTTMNQTEDFFNIGGNISGSPRSYNILTHASNLDISGSFFNSTVGLSSCKEGNGCPIELPDSFYCSQSTIINVTISAANILGEGPHSKPFMTECTNKFVQVVYSETTFASISCIFQNQFDTSEKTCCVTYQLCDQEWPNNVHECNNNFPYRIELKVFNRSGLSYCYSVTASNDTYTMKVEGSFISGFDQLGNVHINANIVVTAFVIILIVLTFNIALAFFLVLTTVGVRKLSNRKKERQHNEDPLKHYLKPYRLPETLKPHKVTYNCELREYFTKSLTHIVFRRGHTYYEFTNEMENIQVGKEVLLQDKKRADKWFRLAQPKMIVAGGLKLYGEGINRNNFGEKYRVFIQSFGSGARFLPLGSFILYNHCDQVEPDVLPLVSVCSEQFAHKVIEEECEVQQFCTQNGLSTTASNIFFSGERSPKDTRDESPHDVILMDKESKELFTGPHARQLFDRKNGGKPQLENEKWNMFVLLEQKKKGLRLKKKSEVLYQNPSYQMGNYAVLEVDQDCVRMSTFIKTKVNGQFEDRKAFYEAEEKEDLLYYRKILRPTKEKLNCQKVELQSRVEYFYAISGAPSNAIELKDLQHTRVFIQSTSQGSRCLKKGAKLLYLIEDNDLELPTGSTDPDEPKHCQRNCQ